MMRNLTRILQCCVSWKRISEFMGHDDIVHRKLYDFCHAADLESLHHAHFDGTIFYNWNLGSIRHGIYHTNMKSCE